MARTDTLGNFLTDVANAIREKKGTTDTIQASEFDTEIASIEGGSSKYAPRHISFRGGRYITEFDYELENLDTSNMTSVRDLFYGCQELLSVKKIDTSKITNFNSMFYSCISLPTIPLLDTGNGTDFSSMFKYCYAVKNVPLLDTSKGTNFSNMFSDCTGLTTIPQIDTSKGTDFSSMFYNCPRLTSLPLLNASSVLNISVFLHGSASLENFEGLKNLGQAYLTTRAANYSNYKLDLSTCNKLTHDSLMNVINNLYDIATKGCKTQALVLGETNISKLTADEIAIATNKGWTVS